MELHHSPDRSYINDILKGKGKGDYRAWQGGDSNDLIVAG